MSKSNIITLSEPGRTLAETCGLRDLCKRHGLALVDSQAIAPGVFRVWAKTAPNGQPFAAIVDRGLLFLPVESPRQKEAAA